MAPETAVYNIPVEVDLSGPLDKGALEAASAALVHRHEALRTVVHRALEGPVQKVLACVVPSLPLTDLCALPVALQDAVQEGLAHEEACRPFDLEAGPPVRFSLFRTAAERHRLLLTVHHLVADGGSVRVMLGELVALYRACLAGEDGTLPEPPLQLGDYVAWKRRMEEGGIETGLD